MRKAIFTTIIVAAFLTIFIYSAHIAISGSCSNTTGASPIFRFTFLQNAIIQTSSSELQNRLDIIENQLRDWMDPNYPPYLEHPPYEVSVNTDMNLQLNLMLSGPPSILDSSTQAFWDGSMCSLNVTRVGIPHTLYIDVVDTNENVTYRISGGYVSKHCKTELGVDDMWQILLPAVSPSPWSANLLLHELGHSVNLNGITTQAYNVMWHGGCGGMASAIDINQKTLFQYGGCADCTSNYTYPYGTYPATPVPWCP